MDKMIAKLIILLIIAAVCISMDTNRLNATVLLRRTIMSENKNIKKIPLTQGQFAIVDNKDFEWLNQYKWFAIWEPHTQSFYAVRHSKSINGKRYMIYMSREILGLKCGDKRQADHINHQTLYNCRANLRIVTLQQNLWNQKNPNGYSWNKRAKK